MIHEVARFGTRPVRAGVAVALLSTACIGTAPPPSPSQIARMAPALPPTLPAGEGWGIPITALTRAAAAGGMWAGTNGAGLWVLREADGSWEQVTGPGAPASDATVNTVAVFEDRVWYGTSGGGFGLSTDLGESWRAWRADDVGGSWAHVAPEGIQVNEQNAWIATLGGLRITADDGATWQCIAGANDAPAPGCQETVASLPNSYLLTLDVDQDHKIWVGHLEGAAISTDDGRSWRALGPGDGLPAERVRHVAIEGDSTQKVVWIATENAIFIDQSRDDVYRPAPIRVPGRGTVMPGVIRSIVPAPGILGPSIMTSGGMVVASNANSYRVVYLAGGERYRPVADMWTMGWWGPPLWPVGASSAGINQVLAGSVPPDADRLRGLPGEAGQPSEPVRPWLAYPLTAPANPFPDPLRPFGGGVDDVARTWTAFNEPAGALVGAVAAGDVLEVSGERVVSRTDLSVQGQTVFAVYDGIVPAVQPGARLSRRTLVGRVAPTSGSAPTQLRIEIRVADGPDQFQQAVPINPVLWIQPVEGTGVVLGRVSNAAGRVLTHQPVHGLLVENPEETPFPGAWTYSAGVQSDPGYDESFAVTGVPAGDYLVAVQIGRRTIWRRLTVARGQVTRVDFAP